MRPIGWHSFILTGSTNRPQKKPQPFSRFPARQIVCTQRVGQSPSLRSVAPVLQEPRGSPPDSFGSILRPR